MKTIRYQLIDAEDKVIKPLLHLQIHAEDEYPDALMWGPRLFLFEHLMFVPGGPVCVYKETFPLHLHPML